MIDIINTCIVLALFGILTPLHIVVSMFNGIMTAFSKRYEKWLTDWIDDNYERNFKDTFGEIGDSQCCNEFKFSILNSGLYQIYLSCLKALFPAESCNMMFADWYRNFEESMKKECKSKNE